MKKIKERDVQPFLDMEGKWIFARYRISEMNDFADGVRYIAMLLREDESIPFAPRMLLAELIDSQNSSFDIKLVPKKTFAQTRRLQKSELQRQNTIAIEAKMRREGLSKSDAIAAVCDELPARRKRSERQLERDMKAEREWRAEVKAWMDANTITVED